MSSTPRRTAFVTGAGTGIGNASARMLLERGYDVFGTALDEAEAEHLRVSMPVGFIPLVLDVRDEAAVQEAAATVSEALGDRRLDAVLNVAGVITNGPLLDLDAATLTNVLAVNVVGVHNVTRALVPWIARGGRIVNVSSQSGRRVLPFNGAYGASKHALEALSTAMRLEFAPFGIEVCIVAPGQVRTPMAEDILRHLGRTPSAEVYREPLRRFAQNARASFAGGMEADKVAGAIVAAVTSTRAILRQDLQSNFFRDRILFRVVPVRPRERIIRAKLGLD